MVLSHERSLVDLSRLACRKEGFSAPKSNVGQIRKALMRIGKSANHKGTTRSGQMSCRVRDSAALTLGQPLTNLFQPLAEFTDGHGGLQKRQRPPPG